MSKQAEWNKCGLFFSPFESKFDRILHALPIPLCPPKGEKKFKWFISCVFPLLFDIIKLSSFEYFFSPHFCEVFEFCAPVQNVIFKKSILTPANWTIHFSITHCFSCVEHHRFVCRHICMFKSILYCSPALLCWCVFVLSHTWRLTAHREQLCSMLVWATSAWRVPSSNWG